MTNTLDQYDIGLPKQFFEPVPEAIYAKMAQEETAGQAFEIIAHYLNLEPIEIISHLQNPIVHRLVAAILK